MKSRLFAIICPLLCGVVLAGDNKITVTAEWLGEATTCQPGKPLRSAVRLVHAPGWHTYWINPGEAGMKITANWKLPPGWQTQGLEFPTPQRFLTGSLVGFGYEGTAWLPVTIIPPSDFKGTARLTAALSWLACSNDSCVPGKAEIQLDVSSGDSPPTPDFAMIQAAHRRVPRPADDLFRLSVTEREDKLALSIEALGASNIALDDREIFPVTADIIDPRAIIRFVKNGPTWSAHLPKSEHAPSPVKTLTIVISSNDKNPPMQLTWKAP